MTREAAFEQISAHLDASPIIDTHDHSQSCGPRYTDPVELLTGGYAGHDMTSAAAPGEYEQMVDSARPLEERWPIVERLWRATRNTGYSRVTKLVLRELYDITEVTLDSLRSLAGRLADYADPARFDSVLEKARMEARIVNVWPELRQIVDGSYELTPRARLTIGLPGFHSITSMAEVDAITSAVGAQAASLDGYVEACREVFRAFARYGAVAFKDQSAYTRPLDYGPPNRAAAEEVFARIITDRNTSIDYPRGAKPLSDYLFHTFLDMAAQLDLPVQIHTGHLAGNYGDIRGTNAAQLAPVLDLHRDVRFDLFHANWPYGGEFLFLGKNYPNVRLNFCWANVIDPAYCKSLFRQALSAVPRNKIHAHGSDYFGYPDRAWASARIARENVASALADAVAAGECDLDEALETATMWFYENPREFFRLRQEGAEAHGRKEDP